MRTRLHADDAPFTFVTALQSHFAVHNLDTNGANVKTLGLGGKMLLDYAETPCTRSCIPSLRTTSALEVRRCVCISGPGFCEYQLVALPCSVSGYRYKVLTAHSSLP